MLGNALLARASAEPTVEALDAAFGIDDALLASEEGVALLTNLDA